jgi:hypothetical protein
MNSSTIPRLLGHFGSVRIGLTILSFVLAGGFAIAEPSPSKAKTPNKTPDGPPEKTPASQKPTGSPKPSATPDTKIDAKTEAELLQAEDRFINAIRNQDAKALEELLHAYYADSIEGRSTAITKRGFIMRASAGRLPAYKVEKERKLTRSGDTFTVEGLGNDIAHELTEDNPTEQWAQVRRIWSREGNRWVATAQIITPMQENEARERLAPDTKAKPPD